MRYNDDDDDDYDDDDNDDDDNDDEDNDDDDHHDHHDLMTLDYKIDLFQRFKPKTSHMISECSTLSYTPNA